MTLRERLADWISGGALTRAMDDAQWFDSKRRQWADFAIVRDDALHAIAAMETPKANATVKRMAKIAREAME
jgi:hypothetical protein